MFVPRKDALPGARHPVEHPSPSSDMWRPIDTAPKDGTWILGMNNRGNAAVIAAHPRKAAAPPQAPVAGSEDSASEVAG